MTESASGQSALSIAHRVEEQLRSPRGAGIVHGMNDLVAELSQVREDLHSLRASLRRRASMQFYVNASSARTSARRGSLWLSVRVQGVICGTVLLRRIGPGSMERIFTPTRTPAFAACRYEGPAQRAWEDPEVAAFISKAAKATVARPEAAVEASLLSMLLQRGARRVEQPVCLAGCPLQVPLPISASGVDPVLSTSGHLDVLSRLGRGGQGLRLYELKRPSAPVGHALDQAVAYAAALRFVLSQGPQSLGWWQLIGFGGIPRRMPVIQAVTLVKDSQRNRELLAGAKERLDQSKAEGIDQGTFYYPEPPARFQVLV